MKRYLFIIILISVGFLAFGQRENTLPRKSTSAATDTIRVVKDNQSALMLRSVLQGAIYDSLARHTDTLQALRADIAAGGSSLLLDSINAHRLEIDDLHDSIAAHRTVLDNHTDSIAAHRTALNDAVDSIADHRTDIDANTATGVTNASNISANSVFISVNTSDIGDLEDSIAKHTDTLQVHQNQISALYDTASVHLDTLQEHNSRLLTLEGESGGYWDRTGTDLSPATSGDDILLASDERLYMGGSVNNSIFYDGTMYFTSAAGTYSFTGTAFLSGDLYGTNGVSDLGDPAAWYQDLYANNHYIESAATLITRDGSNNMTFTDAVTGTKTLAELASSSADSSWISIQVDTINGNTLNSEHAIIFDKDGEDNPFLWMGYDDVSSEASYLSLIDDGARLYGRDYTNGRITDMQLTSEWFIVEHQSSSGTNYIRMDSTLFLIQDGHDGTGIEYGSLSYEDNFTDSTLVHKKYVDDGLSLQYTGSLTDGAPTDAQIDSATGTTPAAVGAGWRCTILDTDGTELIYIVVSDGTTWQYTALTIAL